MNALLLGICHHSPSSLQRAVLMPCRRYQTLLPPATLKNHPCHKLREFSLRKPGQFGRRHLQHKSCPGFRNLSTQLCPLRSHTQSLPTRLRHRGRTLNIGRNQHVGAYHIIVRCMSNTAKTTTVKAALPRKSEVFRLISIAKPERWRLAAAIGFLFISSAVSLAVPFGIGRVIDIIYTQESGDMLKRLKTFCQILLGIFVVGGLANAGRVYLMSTSGQRIVRRMRASLFNSVINQEMAFFDRVKTGELINRLSADTMLVSESVTRNISDGLRSTAHAIGGIGMMMYVSPKLCGVALTVVPPIMIFSVIYGRFVRKITRNVQDALADSTQVAEEKLSNIRTVRAFGHESEEYARYDSRISHVLQLSYKEAKASSAFWGFTGFSGNVAILAVIYSGGLQMSESLITVGELSSFLMYAAYVGISISGLSSFYSELMKGLGASSRIWELIDRPSAIPHLDGIFPTNPLQGDVQFQNVDFAYPTRSDIPVCSNLSLTVPQGTVLAIVGFSGSGKSTLASLLLRYYDPGAGCITVDGQDIREINPTWLRQHMGIVSQEPTLFSTTIAENIAYGASDPSEVTTEQIIHVAKEANAYNFIQSFPNGLDTLVGERGIMLSGGQKQRIAIARAILKNPRILILDEATSALDAESEYLVQEALERVMKQRTVITIAHRLSTIRKADRIAMLHKGQIAELGNFDELLTIPDGHFKRLVERQTMAGSKLNGDTQ